MAYKMKKGKMKKEGYGLNPNGTQKPAANYNAEGGTGYDEDRDRGQYGKGKNSKLTGTGNKKLVGS
jgi:hypothetical protein